MDSTPKASEWLVVIIAGIALGLLAAHYFDVLIP
jgi:disulfide bond formation protein DsbB